MNKKKTPILIPLDPKEYLHNDYEYRFPFEVLDKTPGGSNLGRIEWHVELFPGRMRDGRRPIKEIWIWASQTRDDRYRGRIFKVETYAECITTDSIRRNMSFTPWRTMFCEMHKGSIVMTSYPSDECKELVIRPFSSISCEIRYE